MKKLYIAFILVSLFLPSVSLAGESCAEQSPFSLGSSSAIPLEGGGFAVETLKSPLWVSLGGAEWIWKSATVSTPNDDEETVFLKTATLGNKINSATLQIAGDDFYELKINGNVAVSENNEGNFLAVKTFDLKSYLKEGVNEFRFKVVNAKYFYTGLGTPENNPGGLIFKIEINSSNCVNSEGGNNGGGGGGGGGVPLPPTTPTNNPGGSVPPANPPSIFSSLTNTSGEKNDKKETAKPDLDEGNKELPQVSETETENKEDEQENLDLSALALGATENLGWLYCVLVALAIILSLYILGEILIKDKDDFKSKIMVLLSGSLLASIAFYIFDYLCPILPLLALSAIFSYIVYLKKNSQTLPPASQIASKK